MILRYLAHQVCLVPGTPHLSVPRQSKQPLHITCTALLSSTSTLGIRMNSSEDRKVQSSTLSSLLSYFSQINLWNSQSVCDDSGLVHLNESTTLLEKSNEGRSKFADAQSFDEISTFINERQAALQGELRTINGTTAYHIAKLQAPAFVRDLEVVFLRAEDWNETRASIRMLNFFEAKQSLFGTPALGRQLQITDLDCEALKCLRSGTFQILSSRDKQSRRVLCFFPCNHTDGQIASLVCLTSTHSHCLGSRTADPALAFQ